MVTFVILSFFGGCIALSIGATCLGGKPTPNVEFENYSHRKEEEF